MARKKKQPDTQVSPNAEEVEIRDVDQEIHSITKKERQEMELVNTESIPEEIRKEVEKLTGDPKYWENNHITIAQFKKLLGARATFQGGYYRTSVAICNDKCMLQIRCPLIAIGQIPLGAECPVEEDLLTSYMNQ